MLGNVFFTDSERVLDKRNLVSAISFAMLLRMTLAAGDNDKTKAAFHGIDVICHLAEFLKTLAFMQHDMMALRAMEMASAALLTIYSFLHTHNVVDCHFLWAIVHFSVNFYHVAKFLYARFATALTQEEKQLLHGFFDMFSFAEFAELKRYYRWEVRQNGSDLLIPSEHVDDLMLLTSGRAEVLGGESGYEHIKTLDADADGPQFIGEMAFFTHDAPSVTVTIISEDAHCLLWDMQRVRQLAHSHGHSLTAHTFRQLPSLFAMQLVSRVKDVSHQLASEKTRSKSVIGLYPGTGVSKNNKLSTRAHDFSRSVPVEHAGAADEPVSTSVHSMNKVASPAVCKRDETFDLPGAL